MSRIVRTLPREATQINKTQIRAFAKNLITKPGLHEIKPDSEIGKQLLAKGVHTILVSEHAKQEVMIEQLQRALGTKEFSSPFLAEPSILFNVPEFLTKKGAMLFSRGQVEQKSSPGSKYDTLSFEAIKTGFTDFGEDMVRFMELNGIKSITVLTELSTPAYQKMEQAGQVSGKKLGMKVPVDSWTTIILEVDGRNCTACFNCVLVCPSESFSLSTGRLLEEKTVKMLRPEPPKGPMRNWGLFDYLRDTQAREPHPNRVEIEREACKGCKLCVDFCAPNAIKIGEKDGR
jgi:Pyruvate/2-oxoacid:ferredoxin oxidoreductase delta subunit